MRTFAGMNTLKEKVIRELRDRLLAREKELEKALAELSEALLSDTKSTAGDKHETGRAMTHLEQEKLGTRLQQTRQQLQIMSRIDFSFESDTIRMGSFIKTDKGYYLLAIAFGALEVMDHTYFVLSPASPMGQLLLGSKAGKLLKYGTKELKVESVI
ncbi:MAG: hypothetical protein ACPF9D_07960 [Owenweeksia sp.]